MFKNTLFCRAKENAWNIEMSFTACKSVVLLTTAATVTAVEHTLLLWALMTIAGVFAFLLLHAQLCRVNVGNGVEHTVGLLSYELLACMHGLAQKHLTPNACDACCTGTGTLTCDMTARTKCKLAAELEWVNPVHAAVCKKTAPIWDIGRSLDGLLK